MSSLCPSCGCENIPGEDRCLQCLHSLMLKDIPRPKKGDHIQGIMMNGPVLDLMGNDDLLMCNCTDTIAKVVQIFQKKKKSCVLVMDKHKLVGILSNRDLLLKVMGRHDDLSKVTAQNIMTSNPEVVKSQDPIAFLINKMSVGGFRHVPVLDEDGKTPIGIVSVKDVLRYLDERD